MKFRVFLKEIVEKIHVARGGSRGLPPSKSMHDLSPVSPRHELMKWLSSAQKTSFGLTRRATMLLITLALPENREPMKSEEPEV
jgi:hypothetical protein